MNKIVITLATLALCWHPCRTVIAEENSPQSFSSESLGVTMQWPNEFEQVTETNQLTSQAILLLRSRSSDYPTINLIKVPGPIEQSRAAQSVVTSYHQIGLTDAIVTTTSQTASGWPVIELSYQGTGGKPLHSVVTVIPRREYYFVLTFIDSADAPAANRVLLNAVVGSIVLKSESPPGELHTGATQSSPPTWMVVLGLAVLAGLTTWITYRRVQSR